MDIVMLIISITLIVHASYLTLARIMSFVWTAINKNPKVNVDFTIPLLEMTVGLIILNLPSF